MDNNNAVTNYTSNSVAIFGDRNMIQGAQMLAQSDIIPQAFRGKAANVLVALDMAQRLNAPPMLVMQNLYVIQGKPSWSSQYLIAMINASGRFASPLQYEFTRDEKGTATGCSAWAIDAATGQKIVGPAVTMEMAKAEGWLTKAGSKWQTMPELMLTYRSAAFFARTICPDLAMGMYTEYEQREISESEPAEQYEDKTEQPEPEQKKPSPKVLLWRRVLELTNGDKGIAENVCKAVVSGQEVTDENIDDLIATAEKMVTGTSESDEKEAEEPVPEHLIEEPF